MSSFQPSWFASCKELTFFTGGKCKVEVGGLMNRLVITVSTLQVLLNSESNCHWTQWYSRKTQKKDAHLWENSSIGKYLMSSYVFAFTTGDHIVHQQNLSCWMFDSVQLRYANNFQSLNFSCRSITKGDRVLYSWRTNRKEVKFRLTEEHWRCASSTVLVTNLNLQSTSISPDCRERWSWSQ